MLRRRWFILLCALCGVVVASGIADVPRRGAVRPVGEPDVCEESIKIHVISVRASKGEVFIDPSIASLWKQLSFTDFTGFSVLDSTAAELFDGGRADFPFGRRRLRVDLLEHDGTRARVRLRLYGHDTRKVLDTRVAIHRNRTFFVAGPKIGDDNLILPVTASW